MTRLHIESDALLMKILRPNSAIDDKITLRQIPVV